MKPSGFASIAFLLAVLLAGCSEPCVNDEPLLGEQCGTSFCGQTGYCATDAGPPACVSKKVAGAACARNEECIGGTCELDAGCGFNRPPDEPCSP